jgi:cell fate (sporulation/competence/biofilm development) regulator YmcA (YheA/YmcA/DUF963 family)
MYRKQAETTNTFKSHIREMGKIQDHQHDIDKLLKSHTTEFSRIRDMLYLKLGKEDIKVFQDLINTLPTLVCFQRQEQTCKEAIQMCSDNLKEFRS